VWAAKEELHRDVIEFSTLAAPRDTPVTPPTVEPGSTLAGFSVIARRAADDVWAKKDDGIEVLVATGTSSALGMEENALKAMHGKLPVPRVTANGSDKGVAWIALEGASAGDALRAVASKISPRDASTILTSVLDFAQALEGAGFAWSPRVDDFGWRDGKLGLRRLRGARRLGKKGRIDGRHLIEEIGSALVAETACLLPPKLLHLVLRGRVQATEDERAIEATRAALERATESIDPPEDDPDAATLTDLGLLRDRHEDAAALARNDDGGVLVVCDGVSASHRSDLASQLVVSTVRDRLQELPAGQESIGALHDAIRDAHRGICDACAGGEAAGTTVVAAFVRGRRVSLGWVGDSRAYWLGAGGDALLTRDHSWLNDVLASGLLSPEEALASPYAHALTRCLGPLEGGDPLLHAEPDLLEFEAPGPGHLVLCTDGLWNYFPAAEDLRAVIAPLGEKATAAKMARALVNAALLQGGQDNVTVGVLAVK
jgi:serine/threonine protein phosphatase PrpC